MMDGGLLASVFGGIVTVLLVVGIYLWLQKRKTAGHTDKK
jgi:uncharacterized iron-regulated membrane protein